VPVLESSALPANTATLDLETRARQSPTDKELLAGVIPMPRDCNANGDILAAGDGAGGSRARCCWHRYVDGRIATVAVNRSSQRAGTSSSFCHRDAHRQHRSVQVEVFAEGFRAQGRCHKVTEASLIHVAIDDAGKPQKIAKPLIAIEQTASLRTRCLI
jgi:acyl-CoA thioesterase YciA